MKIVKEYICDNRIPTDEEIKECIDVVNKENCIVKLKWLSIRNGWYKLYIDKDMSFDDCKSKLPIDYGI